MAETLFPQRQRCKKCGKGLGRKGAHVVRGLYDSYRCAGMAEPVTDPAKAPRECVTQRDGVWEFKRRYLYLDQIPKKFFDDPSTSPYWCDHCGSLHIGRTLVVARAVNRGMRSRADLADVLVKARNGVDVKVVAGYAGVRPIRIKEWEDPKFDSPSLDVLFKLLRAYRMDLAVMFGEEKT